MKLYKKITNCRICQNYKLKKVVNLGSQSITGDFLSNLKEEYSKIPLELLFCSKCCLLQLAHTTNPNILYKNYWYVSGTNMTMRIHLKNLYDDINKKINLKSKDSILDIGCNDGTFIKNFIKKNVNIYGIDPAKNPIRLIKNKKINIINNFFNKKTLIKCGIKKNFFKLITSISMFYDVDDPVSFVNDIDYFLDNNGIWVVEMNYLGDMILKSTFDMIGHEHLTYYSLVSFKNLLKKSNLYINSLSFNNINGGSVRFFISKINYEDISVSSLERLEIQKLKLHDVKTYKYFNKKIIKNKNKLRSLILSYYKKKKKIAILGASTRGNTILQFCNLGNKYFIGASDRNPMKKNLFMSGSHIKIFDEKYIRSLNPEVMFVLPYFYKDELIKREIKYLKRGGKFIIPLPKPKIIYFKRKIIEKFL